MAQIQQFIDNDVEIQRLLKEIKHAETRIAERVNEFKLKVENEDVEDLMINEEDITDKFTAEERDEFAYGIKICQYICKHSSSAGYVEVLKLVNEFITNGAPKIKTVPLVDGVVDPMFCNRKLSETTQCGVKPKVGNYCSSHREPLIRESEGRVTTRSQTKSESEKKKSEISDSSDSSDSSDTKKSSESEKKKSESEKKKSESSDSDGRVTTRSQTKKSEKKKSEIPARKLKKKSEPETESEISDSEDEDELLKDAISRAGN